eukprot:COSAG04_NODE_12660_length_641_cov_1.232472_2_plen_49_part_01
MEEVTNGYSYIAHIHGRSPHSQALGARGVALGEVRAPALGRVCGPKTKT